MDTKEEVANLESNNDKLDKDYLEKIGGAFVTDDPIYKCSSLSKEQFNAI